MVYRNDCIASTKVLSRKSGSGEAEALLHRCATAVKHLMRRNGWHIRELSEFYPKTAGLLGMNKNRSVILVRLRYATDETLLHPFEEVLGTLLHELAHMAHSNHSVAFYELWDKNRAEVEADLAGGALNYDFDGPGRVLGGGNRAVTVDLGDPRQKAAEAAIKRKGRFIGSGEGQRLGGGEGEKRLSKQKLKERIARAAERRLNDNKWCNAEEDTDEVYREHSQEEVTLCTPCDTGSSDGAWSGSSSSNRNAESAAAKPANSSSSSSSEAAALKGGASIEMVCSGCGYTTTGDEACPSCQDRILMQFKQRASKKPRLVVDLTSPLPKHASKGADTTNKTITMNNNNDVNTSSGSSDAWECGMCTFLNPLSAAACQMCGTDI